MNIVERLRQQVKFSIECWGGDPNDPDHGGLRLWGEAAAEIERLREENADIRQKFLLAALVANDGLDLAKVIDAAIGMLRAAEAAERKVSDDRKTTD